MLTAAVAVLIVLFICWLIVRNEPIRDANLAVLLRILVSLAVAALGATIPGFLRVDLSGAGMAIRAGGAIALFVLTYFFTPSTGSPPNDTIRIALAVNKFDWLTENVVEPNYIDAGTLKVGKLDEEARGTLLSKVLQALPQPTHGVGSEGSSSPLVVSLTIEDGQLKSSHELVALLFPRYETSAQGPLAELNFGPNKPLDLNEAFRLTANPHPEGREYSTLKIQLVTQKGDYESRDVVAIPKNADAFAFPGSNNSSTSVTLYTKAQSPQTVRVLVTAAEDTSSDTELVRNATARLVEFLKQQLQAQNNVTVSGMTLKQLIEKRKELKSIPWSAGKVNVINQFSVDYIISLKVMVE